MRARALVCVIGAQIMYVAGETVEAIASDVNALIWDKECAFEEDLVGTEAKNGAWVHKDARKLHLRGKLVFAKLESACERI